MKIWWNRKKPRSEGGGWFIAPKTDKPTGMVRLANKKQPGLYYNAEQSAWAKPGEKYTVWTHDDWEAKFSKQDRNDGVMQWEFFGYIIPLYDPDDPNKVK